MFLNESLLLWIKLLIWWWCLRTKLLTKTWFSLIYWNFWKKSPLFPRTVGQIDCIARTNEWISSRKFVALENYRLERIRTNEWLLRTQGTNSDFNCQFEITAILNNGYFKKALSRDLYLHTKLKPTQVPTRHLHANSSRVK